MSKAPRECPYQHDGLPDNTDGTRFIDKGSDQVPRAMEYTQIRIAELAANAARHQPTGRCPVAHNDPWRMLFHPAAMRVEQGEIKLALAMRRLLVIESVWSDRVSPWVADSTFGLPVMDGEGNWNNLDRPEDIFKTKVSPPAHVLWEQSRDIFWAKIVEWHQEMVAIIRAYQEEGTPLNDAAKLCLEYLELLDAYKIDPTNSKPSLMPHFDMISGFNTATDVMWGAIDAAPRVFLSQFKRLPSEEEFFAILKRSFQTFVMPLARQNVAHADGVLFNQIAHPNNPLRKKKSSSRRLFPLNPDALVLQQEGSRLGVVIKPAIASQAYAVNPIDDLTTGCPAQRIIPEVWAWVLQLCQNFNLYERLIADMQRQQ
jgi:hypothetical protein